MNPCALDEDVEDRWNLTEAGQLKHRSTGLCLDHQLINTKKYVYVIKCDQNSLSQKWLFEH
jgi:hypothetical protein